MPQPSPLLRLAALGLLVLSPRARRPMQNGLDGSQNETRHGEDGLGPEGCPKAAVLAEQTRAALLAAAWPGSRLDQDRIELVVFSNHQDFERYFGDFVADKVVLGDYPPTVYLFGSPDRWERRVTLEEEATVSVLKEALAQHLASFFYRRQPRWFSIGLAEYLETLRIAADGRTAILGIPNLQAMNEARPTAASVWPTHWPGERRSTRRTKGAARPSRRKRLMVQWMVNTHLPEFVRFQKLLVTGLDPAKAGRRCSRTCPGDLDKELHQYLHYGSQGVATVTLPESDETTLDSERLLSSADVHALRAEAALAADHSKDAQAELSAALADDPTNIAALRLQMPLLKPSERVALARRATAAHPEDGLAWVMLGDASSKRRYPRGNARPTKGHRASPGPSGGLRSAGQLGPPEGATGAALPQAQAAVRMAPWDAAMLGTLASALAALGRCGEAAATQARAVDMASEKGARRSVPSTPRASRRFRGRAPRHPAASPTRCPPPAAPKP